MNRRELSEKIYTKSLIACILVNIMILLLMAIPLS